MFSVDPPLLQHGGGGGGYETPTPIQQQAIPHLLAGKDLLDAPRRNPAKRRLFLLPILHRLSTELKSGEHASARADSRAHPRAAAQIATSTAT
jgi:ATP-dependent RNA helicase RhlE